MLFLKNNLSCMKKILFFVLHFLFCSFFTFSQIEDPIKWSYKVEPAESGFYNLKFTAVIEDTWHLYSQNIPDGGPIATSFHFTENKRFEFAGKTKELSKALVKFDQTFAMKLTTFSKEAIFVQKIKVKSNDLSDIKGTVEFMCCNDQKCLPPKEVEFSFAIPSGSLAYASTASLQDEHRDIDTSKLVQASKEVVQTMDTAHFQTETASVKADASAPVEDGSLWSFFLIAFLAGIAGIFTPCVYPMIPMTVSFFMRGEGNRKTGILKGIIFGLSIIFIYTMIGVLVAVTRSGADVTSVISTHWIPNLIFFLLFLTFAASFFGMFEIVLPGSLTNKIDQQAEKGGYLAAFFMALTLVVVSFSCTGPIVGAILVEASKGMFLKPVLGMFGFSLAFAIPFVIFAISPALMKKLAKSGSWLNSVKVVFAFVLLAFSLKFLLAIDSSYHFNLLPREVYLSIWIVLFSMLGFYLLGKLKFSHDSDLPYVSVPRLILAVATFSFVVYLVPGLFGAPLTGISSMLPPPSKHNLFSSSSQVPVTQPNNNCSTPSYADFLELPYDLNGYFDYQEGMACAQKVNKPVFLDIKGHACANCKKMEAEVWSDPRVQEYLRTNFVIIALYIDDKYLMPEKEWVTSTYDQKVKKTMGAKNLDYEITHFNINTQPLYAILDHQGNPLNKPMGLNTDVEVFLKFMEDGKAAFAKK